MIRFFRRILRVLPFSPVLFAVSFVLSLYVANIGELFAQEIILPLLMTICFSLFFSWFFTLFLRSREKGEVFSSFFMTLFFSYTQVFNGINRFKFLSTFFHIQPNFLTFYICIGIAVICFIFMSRLKTNLKPFIQPLRVIALILILMSCFRIGKNQIDRNVRGQAMSPLSIPPVDPAKFNPKTLPDIYYIMPEDYSSPAVLQKYFNFDNSSLTQFLQDKGFYIASQSASNYPKSFLSITSSLNMEYLNYLSLNVNSSDQNIVDPIIENNNVIKFLRQLGYHYYQMGSWWQPTKYNRYADKNYVLEEDGLYSDTEFIYTVVDSTFLSPYLDWLSPKLDIADADENKRERIQYQFETIPTLVKLDGPKFVFAHIIAPHSPYVFSNDCQPTTKDQINQQTEVQSYLDQAVCINQLIEKTIISIQQNTSRPSVILLQSDEGAPFLNNELSPGDNWKTAPVELLKEKFPIISAYYFPGVKTTKLYPSISPVNSFRLLFNLYFKTKFKLLQDKQFIFQDVNHLYEFTNVTSKLKN